MRVTVGFEDKKIVVDGNLREGFDFSGIDPNWQVLQWFGENGWIEVKVGDRIWLDTLDLVQPFIAMHEAWTPPPPDPDPEPTIPDTVTPRQVRLLLLQQGLLDDIEAMIAQQDRATQITWEFAIEFKRDNPLLLALAANLNLTSEQLDAFFVTAASL